MVSSPKWQMMKNERGVCSKDLIKPRHGMSCCDSREQDIAVCVCSLQLWIISTLFLLWPTCAERRIWENAQVFHCALVSPRGRYRGSPHCKTHVDFKYSVSGDVSHTRHPRCITATVNTRLHCWTPPAVHLQIVAGVRAIFTSLHFILVT